MAAALGLALAACSAITTTPPTPTINGSSKGGGSTPGSAGGQSANLTFQINFTGQDTVQGSFSSSSWASYSCTDFAKSSFVWNFGIGPQEGAPTTVAGKLVNFLLSVPTSQFHGPGTYTDATGTAGVSVEGDDFFGTDSTMTINTDGTGNASFTNLSGSGAASGETESGTISWTCS